MQLTGAAAALLCFAAQTAQAAEIRGFAVSLFVPAVYSQDDDCPEGKNPNASGMLHRILKDQGMPEAEIQKILLAQDFNARKYDSLATFRGRINGKPVNVYRHPLSVPDPKIKLMKTKYSLGFNLDGREDENDFIDPQTGEKGVDHETSRVFGCFDRVRGTPENPPANASVRWGYSTYGRAWLVEVKGIDDVQNDADVEVSVYRSVQPLARLGEVPQAYMTYKVDADPRMQHNRFRGQIKNGLFVSDSPIDFFMLTNDPRIPPEFHFAQARLRLSFNPDGSVEGFIGGFLPITMIYLPHADYGGNGEFNSGIDYPGIYYAMRRLADTDIDAEPKTGARMRISTTYQIRGVPAHLSIPEKRTAAVESAATRTRSASSGAPGTAYAR